MEILYHIIISSIELEKGFKRSLWIFFSRLSLLSSLFQNSPAQKNDVFHLAIQDVSGIGQVLDYMYTSHLELNQDNVHTLMEIAQSLQVTNKLQFQPNNFPEYVQNIPETSLKFVFWSARKIYFTENRTLFFRFAEHFP